MSASPPRISVLIRSVGRPTLARALHSVHAQQLPLRVLLVRADANPAGDLPLPPPGQTIEPSVPAAPLSRSAAANHLLDRVATELAMFLDDDDELLPGHLLRLLEALDAHPAAPAAYAGVRCVSAGADPPVTMHVYDAAVSRIDEQLQNRLPIHAVLFRTSVVAAAPALRMDEQLDRFEDWDFWLQLMARGGDFVRVPGVSAIYHLDPDTGSGHATPDAGRRRGLEGFAQRQLARWTPADIADLIEAQSAAARLAEAQMQRLQQAREQWSAASAALSSARDEATRTRERLAATEVRAATLEGELSGTRHERDAAQELLQVKRAEFDALQRHAEELRRHADALQAEAGQRQRQLAALQERADALHAEAAAAQQRIQLHQAEAATLQSELDAHRREVAVLAALRVDHLQQIERLQGQVASLLASTSWRLTAPLRLAGRTLAFVRSGRLPVLARNTALAVHQEVRRHGAAGFVRRAPHYLRHARRHARVLAVRPPASSDPDPFSARQPAVGALRMHPEIEGADETLDVRVSVVIPTLNGGEELGWLLRKLRAQRAVREVEVVVVDSGSTDGTPALARELGARVVEIRPQEFTHSHARNVGADAASGDVLLFMVQDAYPIGDLWLHGMLRYLNDHAPQGVMAASCAEYSRSDSDLMYDCNIATHYRFLGCQEADRIGAFTGDDHMALRSMGQLSDVACLIPRPLFMRYRYRGDYAEDLDLGIRLIRDGHKVAMLASVKVIHSHNRPAHYYLKRSFVDVIFLVGLFDDFHCPPCESMAGLADGALQVARQLTAWLAEVETLVDGVAMEVELARWLPRLRDAAADDGGPVATGDARVDAFIAALLQRVEPLRKGGSAAAALAEQGRFVASFVARAEHFGHYLASVHGPADARVRREVADAMRKTLASTLGAALAFLWLDRRAAAADDPERQLVDELHGQLKAGV